MARKGRKTSQGQTTPGTYGTSTGTTRPGTSAGASPVGPSSGSTGTYRGGGPMPTNPPLPRNGSGLPPGPGKQPR